MARPSSSSPEAAFNELSQQSYIPPETDPTTTDHESQPRAKRIACVLCRKRKLRCDGTRPKCGTCSRLSHDCGYDEVRKKSGPKRGYVKLLEARLLQVETLLQKDSSERNVTTSAQSISSSVDTDSLLEDYTTSRSRPYSFGPIATPAASLSDQYGRVPVSTSTDLIGLGLEEPLPPPEVVADLHEIYFSQLHASIPMIHRPRYLAALNLAPSMCPPACLRYIIWALAAAMSDKYSEFADTFYRRARKYADSDEMKGHGEAIITLAHCQSWVLIAWFEFKNMYFPRAWQDAGRAASLAVMMGLNRIDGAGLDVKQCLPPPKDWTEREERRRTFWMAFCADRYASIGTGWALRLDEQDIMTLLPASDEAFIKSQPESTASLEQAFSLSGSVNVSSIASVILIACLLGRNLTHLHRPTAHDNEEDINGEFWQRHRRLENLLANICLALPDHLRIPNGLPDPNVIFMNLLLHTSVICLHQAAIYKADRNQLPHNIIAESRARCVTGASEIARIMKMMSHIDMAPINPFVAFCVYVAARVFVQYLKWRPNEANIIASLQFLGSAMHVLKRRNPLTESFLAQLEVDLEGTGITIGPKALTSWSTGGNSSSTDFDKVKVAEIPVNTDAVTCSPLFEIRKSQGAQAVDDAIFRPISTNESSSSEYLGTGSNIDFGLTSTFQDTFKHNAPQFSMQIPNRSKGNSPYVSGSTFDAQSSTTPSTTDMDYSSYKNSHGNSSQRDSSSHTSFTPPLSTLGDSRSQAHYSPPGIGSNTETLMHDGMFLGAADHNYANFLSSQIFASAPFVSSSGQPKMPQGWDFSNMEVGTGLTPVTENEWNDLEQSQHSWSGMPSIG